MQHDRFDFRGTWGEIDILGCFEEDFGFSEKFRIISTDS
jgi:hypothetical protein